MANEEQVKMLKRDIKAWNKWREENPSVIIDLYGATLLEYDLWESDFSEVDLHEAILTEAKLVGVRLIGANLREASLSQANLHNADLRKAYLKGANLNLADLRGANLNSADLRFVNLVQADLRGVDLRQADLRYADLRGAILWGANFTKAKLGENAFGRHDLSRCIGLENAIHSKSSLVGIESFRISKGHIPEVFLRGCGLRDLDIEYSKLANPGLDPEQVTDITYKIHQLYIGGGLQYYSCFISYSNKDQEFAQQLHNDLQNNSVRCWFAPEDMKIGDQIRPRIDQEIRLRDKLLVILSENSVKSEWVGDEVEAALEEESKSNRLVLFPIRLDDTVISTRDDWVAKIKRRRHIGDFSNWKDKASYQKAFERLLKDLKATERPS